MSRMIKPISAMWMSRSLARPTRTGRAGPVGHVRAHGRLGRPMRGRCASARRRAARSVETDEREGECAFQVAIDVSGRLQDLVQRDGDRIVELGGILAVQACATPHRLRRGRG